MATKINESTEFSIPLKTLVSLLAVVAVGVWAYFVVIERITFLEHTVTKLQEDIQEHEIKQKEYHSTIDDLNLRILELEVLQRTNK